MTLRFLRPSDQRETYSKLDFDIQGLCFRLSFKYAACKAVGKDFDFSNANPEKTAKKQLEYVSTDKGYFKERIKVLSANISESGKSFGRNLVSIMSRETPLRNLFNKKIFIPRYGRKKEHLRANIGVSEWSKDFTSSEGTKHSCNPGKFTSHRSLSELSQISVNKEESLILSLWGKKYGHAIAIYGGKTPTLYDPNKGEFSFDHVSELQTYLKENYPKVDSFSTLSLSGKQDLQRQQLELQNELSKMQGSDNRRKEVMKELARVQNVLSSIDQRRNLDENAAKNSTSPSIYPQIINQPDSSKSPSNDMLSNALPIREISTEFFKEKAGKFNVNIWGATGVYPIRVDLNNPKYIDPIFGAHFFKSENYAQELKDFVTQHHPWAQKITVFSNDQMTELEKRREKLLSDLSKGSPQHLKILRELNNIDLQLNPHKIAGHLLYETNRSSGIDSGYASMDEGDNTSLATSQKNTGSLTGASFSSDTQHRDISLQHMGGEQPFSKIANLSLKPGDQLVLTIWEGGQHRRLYIYCKDDDSSILVDHRNRDHEFKTNDQGVGLQNLLTKDFSFAANFTVMPLEYHQALETQRNDLKRTLEELPESLRGKGRKQLKDIMRELRPYDKKLKKVTFSSINQEQRNLRESDPPFHDALERAVRSKGGSRYDISELGKPGRAKDGFTGKLFLICDEGSKNERTVFRIEGQNSYHLVSIPSRQLGGRPIDPTTLYQILPPQPGQTMAIIKENVKGNRPSIDSGQRTIWKHK